jgi:RNA polymerase sigma-70 factor, ECF subfamily
MTESSMPDWRQIIEKHSLRVFRVAIRILGSVHDAEDVVQEAFTEAYRLHRSGPVQCWTGLLVRLTTLRAIDRLRRRKPVVSNDNVTPSSQINPVEEAMANELESRLRLAVVELPDQQATVFVMAHYEQMTHDAIAEHLNVSNESVASTLYKARLRLAEILSHSRIGR